MTVFDLIGLVAPVLFLYAYAMVSLNRWKPEMLRFHAMNFCGAVAILISLISHWNLPVFVLESCWGAISLYGIVRAVWLRPVDRA